MLQVKHFNGQQLGADLIPQLTIRDKAPTSAMYRKGFVDGPMIAIGPFILPYREAAAQSGNGVREGIERLAAEREHFIPVKYEQMQKSYQYRAFGAWAMGKVWAISGGMKTFMCGNGSRLGYEKDGAWWGRDYCTMFTVSTPNQPKVSVPLPDKWATYPKYGEPRNIISFSEGKRGTVVQVPDHQVYIRGAVNGEIPLGKFKYPDSDQDWGIFATFKGYGIEFRFKRIAKSWYERLWSLIKTVATQIINTIGAFVDWIGDLLESLACNLARSYTETLGKLAAGEVSAAAASKQIKMIPQIRLEKIAANPTQALVTAAANTIADAVCGPPPDNRKYPLGSMSYYDKWKKVYRVAVPLTRGAGFGAFSGAEPTHSEVVPSATDPASAGAPSTTKPTFQKAVGETPWYKSWWFWTIVGTGTAATAGTVYIRRRRRR